MIPHLPRVGVGGVAFDPDGRVLLIRRGKEPLRGRWLIPGGTVEAGETLEAALIREMEEETGLVVQPLDLLIAFDRIQRAGADVLYHYVILDYLCAHRGGSVRAGSDAEDVAWVSLPDLPRYAVPDQAVAVIGTGHRIWMEKYLASGGLGR